MRGLCFGVIAVIGFFLSACSGSNSQQSSVADTPPCTPTGVQVYGANDDLFLTVDLPSDSDPTANPTPQTNIYMTVMVPTGCAAGTTFPVVLNAPAWSLERVKSASKDSTLDTTSGMDVGIQSLIGTLPWYGYVVISFDQRGMGSSVPKNGGGNARIIDPALETQDSRAILDWAYDNAATYHIQTESGTGIAKDIKVGSLGLSYGAGSQLTMAALDPRIDAVVPAMAWHDLAYSLLPGDTVKLSWIGILCGAGAVDMSLTPAVETLCNTIGPTNANAINTRSLSDVLAAVLPPANPLPRPLTGKEELLDLFYTHGMNYFQDQQQANLPWESMPDGVLFPSGLSQSVLRPVPILFLQGNRDVLFNVTEAYWNWRQFGNAGGDVRVLTNEGGHINPTVGQKGLIDGTPDCGEFGAVPSALAWLNHYLKGEASSDFDALPKKICISVANTINAQSAPPVGVSLADFPVGSLSGTGAVPAQAETLSANLPIGTTDPVFLPVVTISGSNQVIAGVPTIGSLTVSADAGATLDVNAFVGVGILRSGTLILVDDQVTGFTAGTHTVMHTVADEMPSEDPMLLLPAVGEQLQDGDQVGLLFYPSHPQYLPVGGSSVGYINPYNVTLSDVELPILQPGVYPGSSLSK